ncbi:MAG: glutathione S-transferase [Myxococcota bacterium]
MTHITLHHLERSRSHRILWLLHELELPFDLVEYKRHPKTIRAPQSLREIHPLGKSPVVSIDSQVIAESGAIIETLVENTGKLGPEGQDERRWFRYWMHYAEGSLMPPLLVRLIFDQLRNAPLPFFLRPIPRAIANKVDGAFTQGEIDRNLAFLDDHLSSRAYFCSDRFTAADIQMSYPVEAAVSRGRATVGLTNLRAWIGRIHQRPAYQKALEQGGPILVG